MISLPIYGAVNRPSSPLPVGPEPPWMHLIEGEVPAVLLVRGSRLFALERSFFGRLRAEDADALAELRELDARGDSPPLEMPVAPAPSSLSLNLAQACNLSCHYCYADEGRFQGDARLMPEHVALEAIDRLFATARAPRVSVGFIGGEPFLNRRVLRRAVEHARQRASALGMAVGFSVTTNGTLLEPPDLDLLRDHGFVVAVSIDGSAETHDQHRPTASGRGSHARALAALEPLLARPGAARVTARASITRDDLRVTERIQALLGHGFLEAGVSPVRTGPRPDLCLHDSDWEEFLREMVRAADAEVARVRAAGGDEPLRFSNLGIALKEIHRGASRSLPCGAGDAYVSVNAEGSYFTCHRTLDDPRFALGDATSGPRIEARSRFIEARRVDLQEPCRSCWARYLCGGGCHAEVLSVGRAGCDYVRGWLEHCFRTHELLVGERPHLFATVLGGNT